MGSGVLHWLRGSTLHPWCAGMQCTTALWLSPRFNPVLLHHFLCSTLALAKELGEGPHVALPDAELLRPCCSAVAGPPLQRAHRTAADAQRQLQARMDAVVAAMQRLKQLHAQAAGHMASGQAASGAAAAALAPRLPPLFAGSQVRSRLCSRSSGCGRGNVDGLNTRARRPCSKPTHPQLCILPAGSCQARRACVRPVGSWPLADCPARGRGPRELGRPAGSWQGLSGGSSRRGHAATCHRSPAEQPGSGGQQLCSRGDGSRCRRAHCARRAGAAPGGSGHSAAGGR